MYVSAYLRMAMYLRVSGLELIEKRDSKRKKSKKSVSLLGLSASYWLRSHTVWPLASKIRDVQSAERRLHLHTCPRVPAPTFVRAV